MKRVLGIILIFIMCITLFPVAFAEGENLLADKNPDLENLLFGGIGLEYWNFGGGAEAQNCIVQGTEANPAHSGNYFVNLPEFNNNFHSTSFELQPSKTYALTFWARSSVEKSGQVDIRFYAQGRRYNEYCEQNFVEFTFGEHLFQEYFGIARPAPVEGEEDTRLQWFKVSLNFTTPPLADRAIITIYNRATDGDPYLCFDSFSLVEENEVNYIRNGGFEYTKGPDILSSWTKLNTGNGTFELVEVEGRGKVIKTTGNELQIQQSFPLRSGRWKLSFDHKPDVSNAYVPNIYLKCNAPAESGWITGWKKAQRAFAKGSWTRYEYYFTVPEYHDPTAIYNGYLIDDFRISCGWGTDNWIDNVKLVPATSSVDFYLYNSFSTTKALNNSGEIVDTGIIIDNALYTDNISRGTLVNNEHEIGIRAHYIPDTLESEKIKLVSALYRVYDDGKIELERVSIVDGETAGEGEHLVITGKVYAPKLQGNEGYTYKLKGFITSDSLITPVSKTTAWIGY